MIMPCSAARSQGSRLSSPSQSKTMSATLALRSSTRRASSVAGGHSTDFPVGTTTRELEACRPRLFASSISNRMLPSCSCASNAARIMFVTSCLLDTPDLPSSKDVIPMVQPSGFRAKSRGIWIASTNAATRTNSKPNSTPATVLDRSPVSSTAVSGCFGS